MKEMGELSLSENKQGTIPSLLMPHTPALKS